VPHDQLSSTFSALADPTRRAILARLAKGEATVNELAEPFDITQPAISQHLKVLEDAGLIVRRVDGTRRPRRLVKARIEAMDEIKRAIEVAEHIPFRFLIQHIGVPNESFNDRKFEAAMTSVEHLRAFAKPLGVRLLLENIPNELSTPDRLVEFIRTSHLEDVGVCFDTGHANMMGDVASAFETVKSHVHSTHVHDNDKMKDSHLWPGKGSINWKETMELLRAAPHTPPLLLEIEGDEKVNVAEAMTEAFKKLEEA